MPFSIQCDDAHRLARIRTVAPFGLADIIEILEWQTTSGRWCFGILIDARRGSPSTSDSMALVEMVRQLADEHGPHGPVAVVARDNVGSAQASAIRLGEVGLGFEVFWDIEEAENWLASQLAHAGDCIPAGGGDQGADL